MCGIHYISNSVVPQSWLPMQRSLLYIYENSVRWIHRFALVNMTRSIWQARCRQPFNTIQQEKGVESFSDYCGWMLHAGVPPLCMHGRNKHVLVERCTCLFTGERRWNKCTALCESHIIMLRDEPSIDLQFSLTRKPWTGLNVFVSLTDLIFDYCNSSLLDAPEYWRYLKITTPKLDAILCSTQSLSVANTRMEPINQPEKSIVTALIVFTRLQSPAKPITHSECTLATNVTSCRCEI